MTKVITIDPGHSHEKPGARVPGVSNGQPVVIAEEDIVFDIGQDLAEYLARWPYLSMRLTRTKDGPHKLYRKRALEAVEAKSDLVICLHANMMPGDSRTHGLTAFYIGDDMVGRAAAEIIARSAPEALLRRPNLRVVEAYREDAEYSAHAWNVMHAYRSLGLSVVLVELGFLTSARDVQALLSAETRPALCACLTTGVARMIEMSHTVS